MPQSRARPKILRPCPNAAPAGRGRVRRARRDAPCPRAVGCCSPGRDPRFCAHVLCRLLPAGAGFVGARRDAPCPRAVGCRSPGRDPRFCAHVLCRPLPGPIPRFLTPLPCVHNDICAHVVPSMSPSPLTGPNANPQTETMPPMSQSQKPPSISLRPRRSDAEAGGLRPWSASGRSRVSPFPKKGSGWISTPWPISLLFVRFNERIRPGPGPLKKSDLHPMPRNCSELKATSRPNPPNRHPSLWLQMGGKWAEMEGKLKNLASPVTPALRRSLGSPR